MLGSDSLIRLSAIIISHAGVQSRVLGPLLVQKNNQKPVVAQCTGDSISLIYALEWHLFQVSLIMVEWLAEESSKAVYKFPARLSSSFGPAPSSVEMMLIGTPCCISCSFGIALLFPLLPTSLTLATSYLSELLE